MPEDFSKELEPCKKERDEYLNGWKRAKADLINYQKEEAKRFEEIIRFANAGMIKELITVLDSFELAVSVLEKQGKAEKGIYMIKSQLEDVLKKSGAEKIAVEIGKKFDPSFQESVAEAESDQPVGTIIEEMEHGYFLHGRVLRPAKVKLSKGKQNA